MYSKESAQLSRRVIKESYGKPFWYTGDTSTGDLVFFRRIDSAFPSIKPHYIFIQ